MAYEIADKILKALVDVGKMSLSDSVIYHNESQFRIEIGLNDISSLFPGGIEKKRLDKSGDLLFWIRPEFIDEARRVIKENGIANYLGKRQQEDERKAVLERLDIESKETAIKTSKEAIEIAKRANEIADKAIRKSNSANVIAFISAITAIVSAIFAMKSC